MTANTNQPDRATNAQAESTARQEAVAWRHRFRAPWMNEWSGWILRDNEAQRLFKSLPDWENEWQPLYTAPHPSPAQSEGASEGGGAEAREYPSVGLFRTSDGKCYVTMKVDGRWVRIIEDSGPVISHYVSHHGIAAAIAASTSGEGHE